MWSAIRPVVRLVMLAFVSTFSRVNIYALLETSFAGLKRKVLMAKLVQYSYMGRVIIGRHVDGEET